MGDAKEGRSGPRGGRVVGEILQTPAILVRRVDVGEADVLATFFTRDGGMVAASASGVRRPRSKLGPLEPLHTLSVRIELSPRSEIGRLRECRLSSPRLSLLDDEARLDAGTRLLRWVRALAPPHATERRAFTCVEDGLDDLARARDAEAVESALAGAGLRLLSALGYALELSACTRCRAAVPAGASVTVDVRASGVVCRSCGGGPVLLRGAERDALEAAGRADLDVDAASLDSRLRALVVDLLEASTKPQRRSRQRAVR